MDDRHHERRNPSFFWPILLIGVGIVLLLSNLGYLAVDPWPVLFNFWPVILIVIGLDIIFGRRGTAGAVIGLILGLALVGGMIALLFMAPTLATSYPSWFRPIGDFSFGMPPANMQLKTARVVHPLADATAAQVQLDFPAGQGSISALADSANLIEADISYYGDLIDEYSSGNPPRVRIGERLSGVSFSRSAENWRVGLNPRPDLTLNLNVGSGSHNFDLTGLKLKALDLNHGSGSTSLTLPQAGQYSFRIDSGSGSVDVRAPQGVAVRVEYTIGSGDVRAPGLNRVSGGNRSGVYESQGFSQSGLYVIVNINLGSGSITVRQ